MARLTEPARLLAHGVILLGQILVLGACSTPAPTIIPLSATVLPSAEPDPSPSAAASPMDVPSPTPDATVYTNLVVLPSPPPGQVLIPTPVPTRAPGVINMQIPAIQVDAKVIEVGWHIVKVNGVEQAVWDNASFAVGHLMNTRNPGEGGNIVFSGHNNIEGKVFANLWKLKAGDEIILTAGSGDVFKYRVVEARIVDEKFASPEQRAANARYLDPTSTERVTLISCYPPTNNTNRVLVVAEPES